MRTFSRRRRIVAMLAIPGAAFAAQTAAATGEEGGGVRRSRRRWRHHTTSGTVKSASDTSLVMTKGGKDETFVVNGSTEKKGAHRTGAHVTVHYTVDGKDMIATAITVAPARSKSKGKK